MSVRYKLFKVIRYIINFVPQKQNCHQMLQTKKLQIQENEDVHDIKSDEQFGQSDLYFKKIRKIMKTFNQ